MLQVLLQCTCEAPPTDSGGPLPGMPVTGSGWEAIAAFGATGAIVLVLMLIGIAGVLVITRRLA